MKLSRLRCATVTSCCSVSAPKHINISFNSFVRCLQTKYTDKIIKSEKIGFGRNDSGIKRTMEKKRRERKEQRGNWVTNKTNVRHFHAAATAAAGASCCAAYVFCLCLSPWLFHPLFVIVTDSNAPHRRRRPLLSLSLSLFISRATKHWMPQTMNMFESRLRNLFSTKSLPIQRVYFLHWQAKKTFLWHQDDDNDPSQHGRKTGKWVKWNDIFYKDFITKITLTTTIIFCVAIESSINYA